MSDRHRDQEFGAFAEFALGRDSASVPVGDAAANSEPYAGAFVLGAPMEALENAENLIQVFFFKTNTVVLDEFPLIVTDSANVGALQPADEISETIN